MKPTKPILILQLRPEDATSNSEFAAILKYGELHQKNTRRIRIEKTGIPKLCLEDYSAIIVGGSPFDISTPEQKKSTIQKQIEDDFNQLFIEIIAKDFPFLGACSGNGLLGSYLGTQISNKYAEPVGTAIITVTEAGRKDPLLKNFPENITVLLGHKEACDSVPKGATLLMTSTACPVQMFRLGQNIYATQFHPEGDSEGFITRIHAYKHFGYFDPKQVDGLIDIVSNAKAPYAQQILQRFVKRYCH